MIISKKRFSLNNKPIEKSIRDLSKVIASMAEVGKKEKQAAAAIYEYTSGGGKYSSYKSSEILMDLSVIYVKYNKN